ncbi:MAG: DUF1150 family protein [Alphaproteobacteria bacterium]|nr:DUF1150 family protein [Alphaproteobacteria bacterium]
MNMNDQSRIITDQDLEGLGLQSVAYVKSVQIEGQAVFSIHAADGTEIAILGNRDVAFATIREHHMEAVSVH